MFIWNLVTISRVAALERKILKVFPLRLGPSLGLQRLRRLSCFPWKFIHYFIIERLSKPDKPRVQNTPVIRGIMYNNLDVMWYDVRVRRHIFVCQFYKKGKCCDFLFDFHKRQGWGGALAWTGTKSCCWQLPADKRGHRDWDDWKN